MNFIPQPNPVPLCQDRDGAIRVQGTRVLLDLVVRAFDDGATPEAIVQRYETLRLADVYAVISYYLAHREEVEGYLQEREVEAEEIRKKIEASQPDMSHIRERIARYRSKEKGESRGN